jgi:hypothetical protein
MSDPNIDMEKEEDSIRILVTTVRAGSFDVGVGLAKRYVEAIAQQFYYQGMADGLTEILGRDRGRDS